MTQAYQLLAVHQFAGCNSIGPADGFGDQDGFLIVGRIPVNSFTTALLAVATEATPRSEFYEMQILAEKWMIINAEEFTESPGFYIIWIITQLHSEPNACAALAKSVVDASIFRSELVAAMAMREVGRMKRCFGYVILNTECFKMIGPYARRIIAFVMNLITSGNRPDEYLVRKTVRRNLHAARLPSGPREFSVTTRISVINPYPAFFFALNADLF